MVEIAVHTVLRPGAGELYDAAHTSIPPELLERLQECGVSDWRIWRDGSEVFHVIEVPDVETYQRMRRDLADDDVNRAWQERLAPLFAQADSYAGDDAGLMRVWSLRGQAGAHVAD